MSRMELSSRRLLFLVLTGAVVVAAAWLARPRLQQTIGRRQALAAPWVDREATRQLLLSASHPVTLARDLWATGRQTHRRAVLEALSLPGLEAAFSEAERERFHAEAAAGPDVSLRELALGRLRDFATPARRDMVARQLADADPELRRAGLAHLARLGGRTFTPWVLRLLDDPELRVALQADAVLRRWSGEDQGLRLSQAPSAPALLVAPEPPPELRENLRAAAARWQAWWATQDERTQAVAWPGQTFAAAPAPSLFAPESGLTFRSLLHARGGVVTRTNLTELRGKKVLLNFWATWCPACLTELPTLRELQRRHPDDLVIIGVSLDRVEQLAPAEATATTDPPDKAGTGPLKELRQRVAAVAGRQRLKYAVWLDPESELGACFDGGELPTNVLLDAEGRVRRRFVGERSLEVWEAMLLELDVPVKP